MEIQQAFPRDFERVYPLLEEFDRINHTNLDKTAWSKLFNIPWVPGSPSGLILEHEGEIGGFIGLIYSMREINGKLCKLCNMSSWIVKEKFRSHSVFMLSTATKLDVDAFTMCNPIDIVLDISLRLGFKSVDTSRAIFRAPLFMHKPVTSKEVEFRIDTPDIPPLLEERDLKIYNHHLVFHCSHSLLTDSGKSCYIVSTRILKNAALGLKIPFTEIHYASNYELFVKHIDLINSNLSRALRTRGMIIDSRFVKDHDVPFHLTRPVSNPSLFKSKNLTAMDIDSLYTELFIIKENYLYNTLPSRSTGPLSVPSKNGP